MLAKKPLPLRSSRAHLEETVSSHMSVHKLCEKYQLVDISWQVFLDSIDTKKLIMSMKRTLPFDIALYDNESCAIS